MNLFIQLLILKYTTCILYDKYEEYAKHIREARQTEICARAKIYSDMIHAVRSQILEYTGDNINQNDIQLEDNIDLFLNPNTDQETINILSDEFIAYFDLYNNPLEDLNTLELTLFYGCLKDHEDIFMRLADNDFLWNNWPINIYLRNQKNIYTLKDHEKRITLSNVLETSFPSTFNKNKERKITKDSQVKFETNNDLISKQNIFVKNTPDEFIEEFSETKNNVKYFRVSRHHIIPLNLISDFFNRYITIQINNQNECIHSEKTKIRNIKIQMLNTRYLNYIRALIGNFLSRGISIKNIRDLFNQESELNNYEKSLYNWNPGNLFYGPLPGKRKNDPSGFFESGSQVIVNEYFKYYTEDYFEEMKELYDRLINLNDTFNENTLMNQCEEYSELFFDLMITFNKVNDGRRGIFGIKFDSKQWKKVKDKKGNDVWEIIEPDEFLIEKNKNIYEFSTPPSGGSAMFNPVLGLGASMMLCNKANIRKRSIHNLNSTEMENLVSYFISKNYEYLKKETSLSNIHNYVYNQIIYKNFTGSIEKNVNELCKQEYITTTESSDIYYNPRECYKNTVLGSTLGGTVVGCAAGTVVFPFVGTFLGCITGMLGAGGTSLIVSKEISRHYC